MYFSKIRLTNPVRLPYQLEDLIRKHHKTSSILCSSESHNYHSFVIHCLLGRVLTLS